MGGLSEIRLWGQQLPAILGLTGLAGAVFFLVAFVALHWLDPSVSATANYVSDYANGPYGRLFQAAMLIHGVGNLAITGGLGLTIVSRAGRWATALFGLASVGLLIAGGFATNPEGAPRTVAGSVHAVAAFAALPAEAMALLLFAYAFSRMASWRRFSAMTFFIALLSTLTLVWLFTSVVAGMQPGLPERASFLVLIAWEMSVAARLAQLASD